MCFINVSRLEEAKEWIERCIGERLPKTTELEESLRNGVYLAKLAHFFAPNYVSVKRIFDSDQVKICYFYLRRFELTGL